MTGRLERCVKEARKVGLMGKTVLDVGCSFGWFCGIALDAKAKEVYGIDPNNDQLKKARNKYPKAKFIRSSAGKLPVKEKSVDVITLFDVIEHVPKHSESKTLNEIFRVLKPGGSLLISTPNNNLVASITDLAWYVGHRHYSIDKLSKMVESSGLSVKSVKTYGGYWEIIAMFVLYLSKWILRIKMPFEEWFDVKRRREFNKPGFTHLYVTAQKPITDLKTSKSRKAGRVKF